MITQQIIYLKIFIYILLLVKSKPKPSPNTQRLSPRNAGFDKVILRVGQSSAQPIFYKT